MTIIEVYTARKKRHRMKLTTVNNYILQYRQEYANSYLIRHKCQSSHILKNNKLLIHAKNLFMQ